MYVYIDGDDIGLQIENCFMDNNEDGLFNINQKIKTVTSEMLRKLNDNGYQYIFDGADDLICKKDEIDIKQLLVFIRSFGQNPTFSFGVGQTLRDAYIALRYAKSNGKNAGALLDQNFTLVK